MRRTPQFIVLALVLAAASACSDSMSARLMAPDAASAVKNSGGGGSMTYTTTGGVTATTYTGNTSGEGNSSCSALGLGSTGTKIDGAYSQSIAGYRFTVSGNKQSLSFAPVAGTTPTTSILGVIVKGATGYNVYPYPAGQTSDAGLTSPAKNGGIPAISHYVVCYGPGQTGTLSKRLVDVIWINPVTGAMETDPVYAATGQVIIPAPDTRWLEYEIVYSLPAGVTGTLTENESAVCNTLGAAEVNHPGDGTIVCSFGNRTPSGAYDGNLLTWGPVSLNGLVRMDIDIGTAGVFCGKRTLVNTVVLNLSNGQTLTAVASTPIEFTRGTNGTCTRS